MGWFIFLLFFLISLVFFFVWLLIRFFRHKPNFLQSNWETPILVPDLSRASKGKSVTTATRILNQIKKAEFRMHKLDVSLTKDLVPYLDLPLFNQEEKEVEKNESDKSRKKKAMLAFEESFEKYFEEFPDLLYNFEFQDWSSALEINVSKKLDKIMDPSKLILSSSNWWTLIFLQLLNEERRIGLILKSGKKFSSHAFWGCFFLLPDAIHVPVKELTKSRVTLWKKRGYGITAYDVNNQEDLEYCKNLDVDVMITEQIQWDAF